MNTHARSAYQRAEIETLTQRDLLVAMFCGMERGLGQAMAAMNERRIPDSHDACTRVKAILVELISSLNAEVGGEIASRLRELYLFLLSRIAEANLRKDPALLAELIPIVADLRQGWQSVPDEFANVSTVGANQGHSLNLMS